MQVLICAKIRLTNYNNIIVGGNMEGEIIRLRASEVMPHQNILREIPNSEKK